MSLNGLVLVYPIDPTGINPNNLVLDEPHTLGPGENRAFVSSYGPFFTESMVVREVGTGRVLTKNLHYVAAQIYQDATITMGKEVCGVVVITDPSIRAEILFSYQVVGGVFGSSSKALGQMIENLNLDHRVVEWGAILGTPSNFPPAPHLHDVGDLYGFEYVVEALEALRTAILVGDSASHEELRQWLSLEMARQAGLVDVVRAALAAHETNYNNPHQVNKTQLGLGNLQNYGIASKIEAETGTSNILYMTPLRTREAITFVVVPLLNAHINNLNNPHATTKTHVGLAAVENYGIATKVEAEAGTRIDAYMTPLRTKEAVTAQIVTAFNAHLLAPNPHNITSTTVGLGSVINAGQMDPALSATFATAAVKPANNITYLNANGLWEAFNAYETSVGKPHRNNINNPHAVTKTQVGLGSVENLGLATSVEATDGVSNVKYMTPLRTKEAITSQTIAYANHINPAISGTNPHGTTKANVGLSAIPNDITNSRTTNSDGQLLTAAGMYNHVASGDHDWRYAPKNTAGVDASVYWNGAGVFIWGGGAWRQVWPAQWS